MSEKEFSKEDLERKITLKAGDLAPEFSAKNQDGVEISLKDFAGKRVVLYFYPKDDTPGCTTQACEFTSLFDEFLENNSAIIGISPDDEQSHKNFKNKFSLKHILLSDTNKQICKDYGVWQLRENFGKKYLGVVRSTFIINGQGKIEKIYKNVKAKDHAASVLKELSKI